MQVLSTFMARYADTFALSGPDVSDDNIYDLLYRKVICNTEFSDAN